MGLILVYDLISENWQCLRGTQFKDMLRAARIKATTLLHSLGVQCTESVILVSDSKRREIDNVINKVYEIYNKALSDIERALGVEFPRPVIRVLSLTIEQFVAFRELAERRLREAIDSNIDRISTISEVLLDIRDSEKSRNLINSLRKLKREWIRIKEHTISIGIPLASDIDYLIELIDNAIATLRGR